MGKSINGNLDRKTGGEIAKFFLLVIKKGIKREPKVLGRHRRKGFVKDKKTKKITAIICDRCQGSIVYHPHSNGKTEWDKVIPRPAD